MIYRIVERCHELIKILFVEKYFVLFIRESLIILVVPFLTLRDRQVVVIGAG